MVWIKTCILSVWFYFRGRGGVLSRAVSVVHQFGPQSLYECVLLVISI